MANAPSWIQNDYWAPDREEVLNDPSRWGTGPNGEVDPATKAAQQSQTQQTQQWDRAKFANEWLGTGNNVGAQNSLLQQYGIDPTSVSGNGTVRMPDGSLMDIRRGARAGDNTAQWMGVGPGSPNATTNYSYSGAPNMPPGPPPMQHDPKWDALYDQLLNRSKQTLEVGANDPVIRAQSDAYAANQQRARRNFLGDLAEQGGPMATGAQLGQSRMTAENLAQNTAGFEGQLMGRELDSRRQEISQALAQMGNMLTEDQRNALQRELGYLNDATQRYGIDQSNATSRYGIDSNAQTAADRLGLDYANSQANYWLRSQGL